MKASHLSAGFSESLSLPAEDFSSFELAREWRSELLDPEGWSQALDTYSRTTNLAVALTDPAGRQIGKCHNPQATWLLARGAKSAAEGACGFCLAPAAPCTAVVDTVRTGAATLVEDRVGLAHVAVPLSLGGQNLGALIAGQVFNRYPEPLPLQRAARDLGISPQRLWHQAIREVPISRANLRVFATLLGTLGQAFLGERYASILHAKLAAANRNIGRSLQEKDVMLREIQHRVKNNLQIVSSLLNMQTATLDSVGDAKALNILEASQQRIAAMARIHELLYTTERIGQIDLAEYVRDLAGMAIAAFQNSGIHIQARFSLEPVPLSMRQAVPCGLIVNELITNVFKYAYPQSAGGEIFIGVKPTGDAGISVTIADSGAGLPQGLDWRSANSVGMQIMRILTTQLGGTLELDARQGASFTLEFRRDE